MRASPTAWSVLKSLALSVLQCAEVPRLSVLRVRAPSARCMHITFALQVTLERCTLGGESEQESAAKETRGAGSTHLQRVLFSTGDGHERGDALGLRVRTSP